MARAGKNVRPPTMIITIISIIEKRVSLVGNVPRDIGVIFFCDRLPANFKTNTSGTNLPRSMHSARVKFQKGVFAFKPAKAEPLFCDAEV